jgi:hypothetical protein
MTTEERKARKKESQRKWNEKNPERLKAIRAKWVAKNREKLREIDKRYCRKNRNKIIGRQLAYEKRNRPKINAYRRNRFATDSNFRLAMYLRNRFNAALSGRVKGGSAVRSLGCSIPELKDYLASKFRPGMTWDNYGEWEIDHILPLGRADLSNAEVVKKLCHYSNLQPLWRVENRTKSASVPEEDLLY